MKAIEGRLKARDLDKREKVDISKKKNQLTGTQTGQEITSQTRVRRGVPKKEFTKPGLCQTERLLDLGKAGKAE